MSLFYLYRFKFAVKLQISLFENAIIGHFAIRAVLALLLGNPLGPNHLVPVFSCEKALNIKKYINKTRRPRSRLDIYHAVVHIRRDVRM